MIRTGLIWSAIFLSIMAATATWAVMQLPDSHQIPVHWNAAGEPDRFAGRIEASLMIWMIPAVSILTAALLAIVPAIGAMKENIQKSRKPYLATWITTMALMTVLTAGIAISTVRGANDPNFTTGEMIRWIIAGCSAVFIVIGNYMPKTRLNHFIGIRTPWTLTSDYTWERTHRFGGRLFMLVGLAGTVTAFTLNGIWLALTLSGMVITAALVSTIYSYVVWRSAPDKRTSPDYIV